MRCPTRCLRLAAPPSPPHLLSHAHVSLPSRLAPLAHATIAAFLSTAYCLVQLSSYPDPARTIAISRSPLAHLPPLRRRRQYHRPPLTRQGTKPADQLRENVTTHTQQSANAREVAARGPTLLPSLSSCPDTSWPPCEIIFLSWLVFELLQRNQDKEHGSTTDMCVLSGDLPPHTL